ncbi:translation initiation factor IF-2, mitochondrial [Hylaeus volcanicus]|uniref:translation initiation factor IF-2, mitochondrial n=1 Tax=Hylaeus volcanicus TaxID=313075 RepID=UPI0023B79089|nr:translation initiation factor IF-2, mitochondrial [Hylaeus volcanicus]
MAASMVRSHAQFNVLRQLLIDNVWREQSTNHILQACALNIQCHFYHSTPVRLKKNLSVKQEKKIIQTLNEGVDNYVIDISKKKKKKVPFVEVWKDMTVKELAVSANRDIKDIMYALYLFDKEQKYYRDSVLNLKLVHSVVKKLGALSKVVPNVDDTMSKEERYKNIIERPPPDKSVLVKRHPVVTIMGHVDHGKTTLLDALRDSSIVESEFGGITQHIGAFNVTLPSGERVTFLDTPGHAAFTSMRHRGAHVTDIVVLVVAADDGVKEQTLQSIEMANDANVPIIVAINKIDKPNADIKRTQNMLAQHGILVEDLGGDVQCINISALKRTNLQDLTEAIAVQADIMGLQGDPVGLMEGVAIECSNHIGRGKLVTALIQRGTLRKGCLLISGLAPGKVRAMFNDAGRLVLEAKPSEAVQIIGWKELPNVGDEILEVENEKALNIVLKFRESQRNDALAKEHAEAADKKYADMLLQYKKRLALRREFGKMHPKYSAYVNRSAPMKNTNTDTTPTVNVIIKGDVSGTIEAILDLFDTYTANKLCRLDVVHYNIGNVTKTDLQLAKMFDAIIYRFNVQISHELENEAKKENISIREYNVIYKLFDDLKEEINSKLPEVDVEEVLGEANVQQVFQVTEGKKKVIVAGCRCTKGVLQKSAQYHVVRNGENIYTGKLVSMRHLKDEVSSIKVNVECGLRFNDPTIAFQPGDVIVCFTIKQMPQTIKWDPGF